MATPANRFNRYNVAVMLVALTRSANEATAAHARTLLEAPDLEKACREAVERGELGGFLEAVVGGDFINAFVFADGHNRVAFVAMIHRALADGTFNDELTEGN